MRFRIRPLVAALSVTALLTGLLGAITIVVAPLPAEAAAVTTFEPGYIISDSIMYDASTMSVDSIQAFIAAKGAGCVPAAGNTCLKDYAETTPTRLSDALCTRAYAGSSNDTAAQIIGKVAVACGINPQVLLVTLQKEQGLVTSSTGKSAATYARALGFGCPDLSGGWCDPQYAGFANQVYSAAKQLQRYAANPASYKYRAGKTNTILWSPNASCGSSDVYIENQATASLYNYTPYRPNDAALAAGYGTGDSCSSYGNRNFHLYFRDWFGSATQRLPFGQIELVGDGGGDSIRVAGWALDPDTSASILVHAYVDGVPAGVVAGASRPDVGGVYGRGSDHGFDALLPASPGAHNVCFFAIDSEGGANASLGCRGVTVVNRVPFGTIDVVRAVGTNGIEVAGWAIDQDVSRPIRVDVYVDGVGVAVMAGNPRPDVQAAYGLGADRGYGLTVQASAGTHNVCLYAIDASGGLNALLGCRTVSLVNQLPVGAIDVIRDSGQSSIEVSGWVFDRDVNGSTDVHIYVDGVGLAVKAANPRPDVDAVYQAGVNHGYGVAIPVKAGAHSVCVYGIDGNGGANVLLGCRTVTVTNQAPIGSVEVVRDAGSGGIQLAGWALDPDASTSIAIEVAMDGATVLRSTAAGTRADVEAAFARGPDHGFDVTVPATAGSHNMCISGIDTSSGLGTLIGCRTVTMP